MHSQRRGEKYFFHFPDGNASIARLLVRKLIPDAIPGNSAIDVVLRESELCQAGRARFVRAHPVEQHGGAGETCGRSARAKEVEVAYARGGKVYTVKAKNCVLACWHVVIPYICEELPRQAETGAGLGTESSAALQQRAVAQLDGVSEAGSECDLRSGLLPHQR